MGYEILHISVAVRVSRHNSKQDDIDNARFNMLLSDVQKAAERHGGDVTSDGVQLTNQWPLEDE